MTSWGPESLNLTSYGKLAQLNKYQTSKPILVSCKFNSQRRQLYFLLKLFKILWCQFLYRNVRYVRFVLFAQTSGVLSMYPPHISVHKMWVCLDVKCQCIFTKLPKYLCVYGACLSKQPKFNLSHFLDITVSFYVVRLTWADTEETEIPTCLTWLAQWCEGHKNYTRYISWLLNFLIEWVWH